MSVFLSKKKADRFKYKSVKQAERPLQGRARGAWGEAGGGANGSESGQTWLELHNYRTKRLSKTQKHQQKTDKKAFIVIA